MSAYFLFYVVMSVLAYRGIRNNRFLLFFYLSLVLYALPAQIGYFYFPELAIALKSFFGEAVFWEVALFTSASLVSLLALFIYLDSVFEAGLRLSVAKRSSRYFGVAVIVLSCYLSVMLLHLLVHFDSFSYSDIANGEAGSFWPRHISILYKMMPSILIVLMLSLSDQCVSRNRRKIVGFFFLAVLLVFLTLAVKIGARTDIISLALGVLCYVSLTSSRLRLKRLIFSKKKTAVALTLPIFLVGIVLLESYRNPNELVATLTLADFLNKDYFAPFQNLYILAGLAYVDPVEVLISNTSNAFFMGHPLLQSTIVEMVNPGVTSRVAGYGFYLLAEGYVFGGRFLGMLYNFVIIGGLSWFWCFLTKTNDRRFSIVMVCLLTLQVFNLARGPSFYFFSYLLLFCIPALGLQFLLTGQRIKGLVR